MVNHVEAIGMSNEPPAPKCQHGDNWNICTNCRPNLSVHPLIQEKADRIFTEIVCTLKVKSWATDDGKKAFNIITQALTDVMEAGREEENEKYEPAATVSLTKIRAEGAKEERERILAAIESISSDDWWDAMPTYKVQKRSGPFAQAKREGRDAFKSLVRSLITSTSKGESEKTV